MNYKKNILSHLHLNKYAKIKSFNRLLENNHNFLLVRVLTHPNFFTIIMA